MVETHAGKQSPQRIEELVKIFIHATRVSCLLDGLHKSYIIFTDFSQMEAGFWDMGLAA